MFDHNVIPVIDRPRPSRKLFSIDEANRSLPYVSRVVVDIAEVYGQVIELRHELENLDDGDLRDLTEREYETTMDRLGGLVDELHAVGVELRDFEMGRVEFPARLGRRDVMLGWQSGQTRVTHYQDMDARDDAWLPLGKVYEQEAA